MYGQYREIVVIAPDPETAAKIHPEYSSESLEPLLWEEGKYDFDIETDEWSTEKDWLRNEWFGLDQWVRPDQLQVTLIGIAKPDSEISVVLSSHTGD